MKHDDLGDRMKKYEYITRTHLVPRMPVIIRIDGRSFHTFTRGFTKPFDSFLVGAMQLTMKYLCENIQGCVLGYTQSDEITLVLVDYKNLNSSPWFDYNIQKCCSIAASMATLEFNRVFEGLLFDAQCNGVYKHFEFDNDEDEEDYINSLNAKENASNKGAMFDARCFNIPKEEVTNCILWRQNDATRNSIEMVGHANFSQSQLHGKSCSDIQDMLMNEKGINWNNFPTHLKRGSCCIKKYDDETSRGKWVIDREIPIFKGEGRKYIDNLVFVENS